LAAAIGDREQDSTVMANPAIQNLVYFVVSRLPISYAEVIFRNQPSAVNEAWKVVNALSG
tara:strand:+ start:957 stop:1136 length:180 start_codon:yes stop_codon:yes gene_type:complete